MKANVIKYIFILFVIAIIGFAIYKINDKEQESGEAQTNTVEGEKQVITNLRLGVSNFDNINPLITKNRDIINLSTLLYEPLLSLTEDYKIELALAEEWSKINDTSYIVKLKEGITWEDGSEVTSKDIQFTIDRLKEGKSVYSDNVRNVKSVDIVDNLTVKINLQKEEPFFEYNLIFPILSNNQFSNEKKFFESRLAPLATGMYKVKAATKDDIELVLNTKWRKQNEVSVNVTNIKINFYNSMGDAYNSFKIGNIDMICTSNMKISDYIGTIGFTTKDYKGRELDFISMNCQNSLLSQKEVRQAINLAIDKKKIISSIYGNEYYLSSFPIDYGNYLYTKESYSSYNQEKAKKVLENAGWSYKYGRWQKTENYRTKTISLNLVVESNNKDRVKVANLIEKQLEDIGIQVYVSKVSTASYKNYLKNKNYELILTGTYNGYSPNLNYYFGNKNIANYENDEMKQILSEVNNITDEKLLKEKYDKIVQIYEEDIPYVCLYRNKGKVVYSMKMTGEFKPNNYTAYYYMEKWYRQ